MSHGAKPAREGGEETLILGESKQPQRSFRVKESLREDDNQILHLLSIYYVLGAVLKAFDTKSHLSFRR